MNREATRSADEGAEDKGGCGPDKRGGRGGWFGRPARWPLLRSCAWLCCIAAGLMVVVALLWRDDLGVRAGAGGDWFVMASHAVFMTRVFWFHLGIAFAVAAGFGVVARARRLALGAGVFAVFMLGPIVWEGRPRNVQAVGANEAGLTVMSVNLMYGQTDISVTLAEIARVDPDVVLFQEWTPKAEAGLAVALRATHPHHVMVTREDAFGQAVFSKLAFVEPVRPFPDAAGAASGATKKSVLRWSEPQMRVVVDAGAGPVVIYNVHVLPPVGLAYIDTQRQQTLALAEIAKAEIEGLAAAKVTGVVFVGDFNATANTAHLAAMHDAGLKDAVEEAGQGWASTWPRTSWLRHLPGIRLDHVLGSEGLRAVSAGTGADNGSDHRPVWVRFAMGGGGASGPRK